MLVLSDTAKLYKKFPILLENELVKWQEAVKYRTLITNCWNRPDDQLSSVV